MGAGKRDASVAAELTKEWEKYTLEQVASDPDLMICDGWVLNVKSFKADHPGGAGYIDSWAGRDISEIFNTAVPHKHSSYASRVLETLRVGVLIGAEVAEDRKKYAGLIDVDAPFLTQIGKLEANYHPWMESQPVVRKLTIFPWPALEALSRYPWWWIWVGVPPLTGLGIYTSAAEGMAAPAMLSFFLAGLSTWVLLEYILHRYIFHIMTESYFGNLFHFFAHGLHHLTPHDTTRLTFPPPFTYLLAALFWQGFKLLTLGHPGCYSMFSGLTAGYIAYDTTHFLYHHTDGSRYMGIRFPGFFSRYLRFMKSHHNVHHFLNDECNYGVSSPVLDYLFGTYMSKKDAEAERERLSVAKKVN